MACLSAILLLHTFFWFLGLALVKCATLTVVNNCTQTIWPAILGTPSLDKTGFELPVGGTRVLQPPKGWHGQFWARTGCTFDATSRGSCVTGDCGSGQIECDGPIPTATTLAEFAIDSFNSLDFYDISLAGGYNLPMLIEGKSGSGQRCESTGCIEDLNRLCPEELRAKTGDACQNACNVFPTSSECGPSKYSQLFKNSCPTAYSFPKDDATSTFTCSSGDYVITFCPSPFSMQNEKCTRPLQCGGISNISYPFWGGNRPEICGFPGFGLLNCQGDVPMINIDSRSFRVLEIDYSSQTLKVARQDLWNNTCPGVLYNTTFDINRFSFPQSYTYDNVTLYYNCTRDQSQVTNGRNQTNQFTCNIDQGGTLNLFAVGKSSELGSNFTCNNNISVPVNQSAAQTLSTESASLKDLQDALASGFSIQWLNSIASCHGCVRSGGVCGYDLDSTSIICNISHRILNVSPTIGFASAHSPGPSPFYYTSTGDPPALSPGSFPFYFTGAGLRYGESEPSVVGKVLIGLATVVTVAVAVAVVVYIRKRRLQRLQLCLNHGNDRDVEKQLGLNQGNSPNVENFLLNHESLAPKKYKYSQIKKITKSFSDKLGKGGYGSVYKGTLPNGQFVAVKLLTETNSNGEDFINEVASISRTSHVNIVNLLGFCYEKKRRALVYEFMPNKSLDKFINNNGSLGMNCSLDWETLYKIAVGVARGLEYLHKGCNTRIVHFDIKPQNILLDEEFCPKISDFGLAKLCKKKQSILSMAGTRGTIGYIAPEVFSRNFGGVSHKSDVYSYGMMVLEVAGARNVAGLGSMQSSENYFPDKIYEQVILRETKNLVAIVREEEEEEEAIRKLVLVGFWCIQTIPSDRPSMSKVVEMLEGSLESIRIPPKPFLCTPVSLGEELSPSASCNAEMESCIE